MRVTDLQIQAPLPGRPDRLIAARLKVMPFGARTLRFQHWAGIETIDTCMALLCSLGFTTAPDGKPAERKPADALFLTHRRFQSFRIEESIVEALDRTIAAHRVLELVTHPGVVHLAIDGAVRKDAGAALVSLDD